MARKIILEQLLGVQIFCHHLACLENGLRLSPIQKSNECIHFSFFEMDWLKGISFYARMQPARKGDRSVGKEKRRTWASPQTKDICHPFYWTLNLRLQLLQIIMFVVAVGKLHHKVLAGESDSKVHHFIQNILLKQLVFSVYKCD